MIELIPISVPQVDWEYVAAGASEMAGRDLISRLDRKLPAATLARLIALLRELRPGDDVLRHLSFTFLVKAEPETLLLLLERTSFVVTLSERTAIVTANLKEWRAAIEEHCSNASDRSEIRQFYNMVMVFMVRIGLGSLWSDRIKTMLPDSTFLLST